MVIEEKRIGIQSGHPVCYRSCAVHIETALSDSRLYTGNQDADAGRERNPF